MIINEFVNEKEDLLNITYPELMKKLTAINGNFKYTEIVPSEPVRRNIISEFVVIRKSSPGVVSVRTVQDYIKELNVVVKEVEDLNKKYAGKYFVSRDAIIGKKLEKEFPKLTKKYFGKEIKVVFLNDITKNDDYRCIGYIYPAEYNEETVEFFDNVYSWSRGNPHKNYRKFMDDLEKIGVDYFEYATDHKNWVRLYVMHYPVKFAPLRL